MVTLDYLPARKKMVGTSEGKVLLTHNVGLCQDYQDQ